MTVMDIDSLLILSIQGNSLIQSTIPDHGSDPASKILE